MPIVGTCLYRRLQYYKLILVSETIIRCWHTTVTTFRTATHFEIDFFLRSVNMWLWLHEDRNRLQNETSIMAKTNTKGHVAYTSLPLRSSIIIILQTQRKLHTEHVPALHTKIMCCGFPHVSVV